MADRGWADVIWASETSWGLEAGDPGKGGGNAMGRRLASLRFPVIQTD